MEAIDREEELELDKKSRKKEDAIVLRLRFLLIRVWFIKNWFTLFIIFIGMIIIAATAGLIPESMPVIGTFSYALKDKLQTFLEIGDEEFYSIFGSITGLLTLLWGIGYASSKIKSVSYYMIDKSKLLKYALSKGRLSLDDKGKIIRIEKRLGIDLDGDNMIAEETYHPGIELDDNIISDIFQTFSELKTIINVPDETLREAAIEEKKEKVAEVVVETPAPEVVKKKPSTPFKSNRL